MAVVKKSNTNRQAKNIQIKTSAVVVFPVDRISPYDAPDSMSLAPQSSVEYSINVQLPTNQTIGHGR